MIAHEVNFDGLVGPTHNYAGLSLGNVASLNNKASESRPKEAALQGLQKMKFLADKGFIQGVLPPHERPALWMLRHWGFQGKDDATLIHQVAQEDMALLQVACSASAMWTANAATVTPSADSLDNRVHFTPANLSSKLHRAIEAEQTEITLRKIFASQEHFQIHSPLQGGDAMADEGAANHTRLCLDHGNTGLHLFVFGRSGGGLEERAPSTFPARQTRESCSAIARNHRIPPRQLLFIQQNPDAIDAGVFHNDVIAVGNTHTLFCHELAFAEGTKALNRIQESYRILTGAELNLLLVPEFGVSLSEAISTYLFNSQLLTTPEMKTVLLAPRECEENKRVNSFLESLVADPDSPLSAVWYKDLRQSMRNGGGPACLRLRVALTGEELSHLGARVILDDILYEDLTSWVNRHYRDTLQVNDLRDPNLVRESRIALDELTQIMDLGAIYPIQLEG